MDEYKQFLATSKDGKGRSSHYHIVFLDDLAKTGIVAPANKHEHPIEFRQETELVVDPATGQEVESVVSEGWIIGPGGKDNHVHPELGPVPEKKEVADEEDKKKVQEVLALYATAREQEFDSYEDARDAFNFYYGKQWKDADRQVLRDQGRPALTFNEIRPKIDLICGYQRRNRTDFNFLPVEGGDQRAADIIKIVVKNIMYLNEAEQEESSIFKDGTIGGRGNWNLYVDYDKNIHGDITIERFPWDGVFYGPHEKINCEDLEYLCKRRMYSLARLKSMYPDLADKFSQQLERYDNLNDGELEEYSTSWKRVTKVKDEILLGSSDVLIDISKRNMMIIECWRKKFKRVNVIQFGDFVYNAEKWNESDVRAVKELGARVYKRNTHVMRVTKIAGLELLEDEFPDLAVNDFNVIPFYAYKEKYMYQGKVHDAKDPQREENKRTSQMMDIVNKTSNYGWFFDEQTFANKQEENNFRKTASRAGFMSKLQSATNVPVKVEGSRVPTEVIAMADNSAIKLRQIMNINEEMLGEGPSGASGRAIQQRKLSGLVGNEFLFDNFSMSKKRVGRMLIKMIIDVYTTERILRLIDSEAQRDQSMKIGSNPYFIIDPETGQVVGDRRDEIREILENDELSKIDIVVDENPWSPSIRIEVFNTLVELMRVNPNAVPPQILMEMFPNLPEDIKNEALQAMQEQMRMQQEMEMMKYNTEIEKTLLNNQAKTGQGQSQLNSPQEGIPS